MADIFAGYFMVNKFEIVNIFNQLFPVYYHWENSFYAGSEVLENFQTQFC